MGAENVLVLGPRGRLVNSRSLENPAQVSVSPWGRRFHGRLLPGGG